jgi:hypothetical protein
MSSTKTDEAQLSAFLAGKTEQTLLLLEHFINVYKKIGKITLHPTKSMIGIAKEERRIAWVTQLGKNFVHVVFPFRQPYTDNLCFQKIAQVPGEAHQYNHHLRIYHTEDLNEEVIGFMKWAYSGDL